VAAVPTKYAVPIQERLLNDEKDVEITAVRVATMVESTFGKL
jgi:hypothetical protein